MTSTAALIALSTQVTVAHPSVATYAQAHVSGCKAAYRQVFFANDLRENAFTVAALIEMQANPDEGHFKIHACLKPVLAAAKKG